MVMVLYRSNALSSGLQAEDPTCATSSEVTFRRASLVTPVFSNSLATFSKFRCNKRKSILYKQFHNTAASGAMLCTATTCTAHELNVNSGAGPLFPSTSAPVLQ